MRQLRCSRDALLLRTSLAPAVVGRTFGWTGSLPATSAGAFPGGVVEFRVLPSLYDSTHIVADLRTLCAVPLYAPCGSGCSPFLFCGIPRLTLHAFCAFSAAHCGLTCLSYVGERLWVFYRLPTFGRTGRVHTFFMSGFAFFGCVAFHLLACTRCLPSLLPRCHHSYLSRILLHYHPSFSGFLCAGGAFSNA